MLFERGEKVPGQGLGAWVDRQVTDPSNRIVVFDAGSHLHLALYRSTMLDHIDTIMATVAEPDFREPDPIVGRERFYIDRTSTADDGCG
jgi:hypothetical protein